MFRGSHFDDSRKTFGSVLRLIRKTRRWRTNVIRMFRSAKLRADVYYRRRRAIEVGIVTSICSSVCTRFQNVHWVRNIQSSSAIPFFFFFFHITSEMIFTPMPYQLRYSRANFLAFQMSYLGCRYEEI